VRDGGAGPIQRRDRVLAAAGDPRRARRGVSRTRGGRLAVRARAQAFDWRRHAGERVRHVGLKGFVADLQAEFVPEFQSKTGINLAFENYEQAQARQKLATELVAGTATVDTFPTTKMQDFQQYWRNGWYEVLDPYLASASKTDPELQMSDFFPGALETCKIEGKLVALPFFSGAQILFYRKDLLDEKGVKVPTTLEELEAAAKALHNPPNVYGFVSRGQKSAAISMFAAYLHNFGADWMAGGKPSLTTPEAIAAYEYYGRILASTGRRHRQHDARRAGADVRPGQGGLLHRRSRRGHHLRGRGQVQGGGQGRLCQVPGRTEGGTSHHLRLRHGHDQPVQAQGRHLAVHPVGERQVGPGPEHAQGPHRDARLGVEQSRIPEAREEGLDRGRAHHAPEGLTTSGRRR
jgi:hypothetical protein